MAQFLHAQGYSLIETSVLQTKDATLATHAAQIEALRAERDVIEREAEGKVVAWLRNLADVFQNAADKSGLHQAGAPIETLRAIADTIERREHLLAALGEPTDGR